MTWGLLRTPPWKLDASSGPPAEEFPKPGPESPPINKIEAASPESVWDCEIRIDKQDRTHFLSAAGSRSRRYRTAIITGSVLLGLGLGLGWLSRSIHLFAAATPNKPVPSHCATDFGKETTCTVQTSEDSPAPTSSGSQNTNVVSLPTKQTTLSPAPTVVSLPTKQTTLSPAPTAVSLPTKQHTRSTESNRN